MRHHISRLWRGFAIPSMAVSVLSIVAILAMLAASAPIAVGAPLPGSTFESDDGNLVVNTPGNTDWANAPNRVGGVDQPSGSNDNSFGQGTKEDNAAVTVVSGSIPPNKSDLTRFYVASEFVSGSNFLYLAWERSNVLGSANMDFEINQNTTPGFSGSFTGPITINRTAGDLLITYDFANGGNSPSLGLLTWVTSGAVSQCFSANALPCWGNRVDLSAAGFANGAINTTTVTDPIANVSLPASTFGEAAVNLQAAGVFPPGTCKAFGDVFLKSRSSASFTAEVKDFVAPQPVNISNCGNIKVTKVTQNGDSTFGYTTTGGLNPSTFNLSNGQTRDYGNKVPVGSYTVSEGAEPSGWDFVSLVCTPSGAGTSVTTNGVTASITIGSEGEVDCTYTNHTKLHPSITTSLSASDINAGQSAHDSATLTGATANAGGTVTYTVFTDNMCQTIFADAGTVTVTNGSIPDSNPVTFPNAGTYYWQAHYSGDDNNTFADSVCTSEVLVVHPIPTAISTAQNVIPNDTAALSGGTGNETGTITFKLFAPSDATCSGAPAFTQIVNVSGNGTYGTTNSPTTTNFIASASGEWRWQVVYSGDNNNVGSTSACGVEIFTITNG